MNKIYCRQIRHSGIHMILLLLPMCIKLWHAQKRDRACIATSQYCFHQPNSPTSIHIDTEAIHPSFSSREENVQSIEFNQRFLRNVPI